MERSELTWARLLAAAQADADARGEPDWPVAADSSLMRVHQHGASARRIGGNAATAEGPVPEPAMGTGARSNYTSCWADPRARTTVNEPAEHAIGRSRGGLTSKLHMLTDGQARPLVLVLTASNVNDTTSSPSSSARCAFSGTLSADSARARATCSSSLSRCDEASALAVTSGPSARRGCPR